MRNFCIFGLDGLKIMDVGQSILLYDKNRKDYRPCNCFINAFQFLTNNMSTNRHNKAYIGYVLSTDGQRKVAVRHAWNSIKEDIVDVTMIANGEHPLNMIHYYYLPIMEYTNEQLLDAIEENNGYADLPKTTAELEWIKKLASLGFDVME